MDQSSIIKQVARLKGLSVGESMKIMGDLIDDLVQTYYASLKQKYPKATFNELIRYGHQEAQILLRRREYND